MNHKIRIMAGALALSCLVIGLSGCDKAKTPTESLSTVPTLTEPQPSTTPAGPSVSQTPKVKYKHCGLQISLPEGAVAGSSEEDANLFTFSWETISGTIRFGTLAELGDGATTSLEYALNMVEKYGSDTTKEGTSTNTSFYARRIEGDDLYMYSLYTYTSEDTGSTVCWLIEAKSHKDQIKTMQEIVGCCGYNAAEIPEL